MWMGVWKKRLYMYQSNRYVKYKKKYIFSMCMMEMYFDGVDASSISYIHPLRRQ